MILQGLIAQVPFPPSYCLKFRFFGSLRATEGCCSMYWGNQEIWVLEIHLLLIFLAVLMDFRHHLQLAHSFAICLYYCFRGDSTVTMVFEALACWWGCSPHTVPGRIGTVSISAQWRPPPPQLSTPGQIHDCWAGTCLCHECNVPVSGSRTDGCKSWTRSWVSGGSEALFGGTEGRHLQLQILWQ